MKIAKSCSLLLFAVAISSFAVAQKPQPAPAARVKPVVFAVVNDGRTIEPVAFVDGNGLTKSVGGDDGRSELNAFSKEYYKKNSIYKLVFGGSAAGTIRISKPTIGECSGNSAEVTTQSARAKLKGFVMALAVMNVVKLPAKGFRRMPTSVERAEIDGLAQRELSEKAGAKIVRGQLRYHNLTALDLDNDGVPEFVGSYWIAPKEDERKTLFLIAEKGAGGKYTLAHAEFEEYTKDNVMSGEVKDLDDGIYHNLLLDVLDYDNDGVSDLFITAQAFEGRNFYVYKRTAGKWNKVLEAYNYRCGY